MRLPRLHAFGADAYRLATGLRRITGDRLADIEGHTGRLSVGANHRISRRLAWARFVDGAPAPHEPDSTGVEPSNPPADSPGAIGSGAEGLAERFLSRRGLMVVRRNYRCRRGEIDLVMRDTDTLVFVEVRRRTSLAFGGGLTASMRGSGASRRGRRTLPHDESNRR